MDTSIDDFYAIIGSDAVELNIKPSYSQKKIRRKTKRAIKEAEVKKKPWLRFAKKR